MATALSLLTTFTLKWMDETVFENIVKDKTVKVEVKKWHHINKLRRLGLTKWIVDDSDSDNVKIEC